EQVTTVDVAGESWDLYQGEVLDDDGDHLWWVHSFVHTSGTNSFEADLSEFTDILVERDELSTDQYLTSVQAGVEVVPATGEPDTAAYRSTVGSVRRTGATSCAGGSLRTGGPRCRYRTPPPSRHRSHRGSPRHERPR